MEAAPFSSQPPTPDASEVAGRHKKQVSQSSAATTTDDTVPVYDRPTSPSIAATEEVDPFADDSADGAIKYKTLSWWQCSAVMIAETISLGILSLPAMVSTMGFVPGVLLIAFFGILATYTGYVMFLFRQAHKSVHSFSDAAELMCGPWGKYFVDVAQALVFIFIMAAHILAFTIAMNVLTHHATCSLTFAAVGTVLSLILSLPRTLKKVSWISTVSCVSVCAAVIVTMIAVGIQKPNATTAMVIVRVPDSAQAYALAISNIVIAFTGHTAYFQFMCELRDPHDFPKSLALLQTIAITYYIIVAAVIYNFAGDTVTSPALGSAGPLVRKIAYGIAFPTIVVAGVVNAHVCVKNIYVRIYKGTGIMQQRTSKAIGSWVGMIVVIWIIAFVIANAIPVFSNLLAIIGALLCSWFSLGFPAIMWLYLNKGCYNKTWKKRTLVGFNVFIFLVCCLVCLMGTWGAVKSIVEYAQTREAFSCDDIS